MEMIHSNSPDSEQHWQFGSNVFPDITTPTPPFMQNQDSWRSNDNQTEFSRDATSIQGKTDFEEIAGQSENDSAEDGTNNSKLSNITSDMMQDLSPDQQQRRRKEQNRAAQRAFRERKERYVKELESKIKQLEKEHENNMVALKKENLDLHALVKRMETEIYTLKGAAAAFDMSMKKLREAGIEMSSIYRELSPPTSDYQSPGPSDDKISPHVPCSGACTELLQDPLDTGSVTVPSTSYSHTLSDSLFNSTGLLNKAPKLFEDIREDNDAAMAEEDNFAESHSARFDHTPDPITLTGVKLIPCSQVWERLAEHPEFEDFDLDGLCEELKKKAKCSSNGPVITESEFSEVIQRLNRQLQSQQ